VLHELDPAKWREKFEEGVRKGVEEGAILQEDREVRQWIRGVRKLPSVSYQFERRAIFGQAPPRCGYHSVTLQDSRLLILGGFDGSHVFGEAWRLDLASWAYLPQVMTFEIGSAASIGGMISGRQIAPALCIVHPPRGAD